MVTGYTPWLISGPAAPTLHTLPGRAPSAQGLLPHHQMSVHDMELILKRAVADPEVVKLAQEVVDRCATYRLWLPAPSVPSYRAQLATGCNEVVIVDNLFDGEFKGLVVIGEATELGQAEPLASRGERVLWAALCNCWIRHHCLPRNLCCDTEFCTDWLADRCAEKGVELQPVGAESHFSVGLLNP